MEASKTKWCNPRKVLIKGVPSVSVLRACWVLNVFYVNFWFHISRTQQTLNTLMPGTSLIEIFLRVNSLRLGGIHLYSIYFIVSSKRWCWSYKNMLRSLIDNCLDRWPSYRSVKSYGQSFNDPSPKTPPQLFLLFSSFEDTPL